jgi:hypothetical protein
MGLECLWLIVPRKRLPGSDAWPTREGTMCVYSQILKIHQRCQGRDFFTVYQYRQKISGM